jgi:hypothetical protein
MRTQLRPWQFHSVLFGFAAILHSYASEVERYRFEEGEPLTYKTRVTIVVDTARESKYFEHFGKSNGKTNVSFDLDYQLLPIAHEQWWKVRLVLDQVNRTIDRDGKVETATFDRAKLKSQQLSAGDMLNLDVWGLGLDTEQKADDEQEQTTAVPKSSPPTTKIDKTEKVRVPEDLFDQPILTWFASDGTLEKFENRAELEEIMEGLDLKECIKLLIPPLPNEELKVGVSWTRQEDVDLPEPPLKGQNYERPTWQLTYTVKSIEHVGESMCARIAVRGTFAREGLWIPIAQQTRKYLIWTTMITKLQDQIDGEFVYDLEQKVMRASTVKNTYRYSTVEARKADNYRGQILTDTNLQTRITSALVETAPGQAESGSNVPSAPSPMNHATSDVSNEITQIFANQTFNKPKDAAALITERIH